MDITNVVELASGNAPSQAKPITDHEEQLKLLLDKAEIHISQKQYDNAETALIHAFIERVHIDKGVDSNGMLDILHQLSDVLVSNKHKHLVEVTKEASLKLKEKLVAAVVESHFFIEVLFEIAKGYYAKNNSSLADEIMHFIIKKQTELEGDKSYLLSSLYTTRGEAYRLENLYNEAISCHELALTIRKEMDAKPDHDKDTMEMIKRDMADSLTCLGFCHRSVMKYAEAEKNYEDALAIRREHLRHIGPLIGKSYNDLAELLRDKKDYEKAIRYHVAAVETFTRFFSPDHPRVINAKGNYGVTLIHQSRNSFELGSALVKEAMAYFITNKYPSDHVWVVKFRGELAIENVQHELEDYKKRVKKFQTEQVLKEIEERLQEKRYEQLVDKIKNQESEHRNEINKIKFMNSVLTEQVSLNKSTTTNLLVENNDLLEKIETLITKQKLTASQHDEENKKMQEIFAELLTKTEELEAKDARFQLEEERLLEENDSLNTRDNERLTEIESLGRKIWALEQELKVALHKNTQLEEQVEILQEDIEQYKNKPAVAIIKAESGDCSTQTDFVNSGEQGCLEKMSHVLSEDCVVAAMKATETLADQKRQALSLIAANETKYIPNDSEEFVRHQYPLRDEEQDAPSVVELQAETDANMIQDLSVSLKMEEIMSATAFSLLEETQVKSEAEREINNSMHKTAVEGLEKQLSALQAELSKSKASNQAYEDELGVLRIFMKEHDLDPKKTKLKALKAKVLHLEDEATERRYKIDELETELFTLKIDHAQVVQDNEKNCRTAIEITDSNHLLTLQLKAANYEIEHMSAELHLDRHKASELQRDFEKKCVEINEQKMELTMCQEHCAAQRDTIVERDLTIENLKNEILDLKGISRKDTNQTSEKETQDKAEGKEEMKVKNNPKTCFLTDLDLNVEEVPPPSPSPGRVAFLPALDCPAKNPSSPRPDAKSTVERDDNPPHLSPPTSPVVSHRGVNFLQPLAVERTDDFIEGGGIEEESSSDFAEVLFLKASRTPKNLAALKRAKHTKDKDKYLKKQKHYCTMCDQKMKGAPKVIPTSLQNVLQPGESFSSVSISSDKDGSSAKEFQLAGFPKSSKNYLDSQVIWRETYATRGEDCIFCSWDCARDWNKKYTPVNYRYTTLKLIDIAAGKFIS